MFFLSFSLFCKFTLRKITTKHTNKTTKKNIYKRPKKKQIMSIATLKRKTAAKYNVLSFNQEKGFSLNGAFRGQGYIGQSTQARTLVRSLAKGPTLRGHGGCCGTYNIVDIKPTELQCLDDPTVVRPSSLNNQGMIFSKYRWIRRPQPYTTVKRNGAEHAMNSQSSYIETLVKNQLNASEDPTSPCYPQEACKIPCRPIGAGSFRTIVPVYKTVIRPEKTGAISHAEYLRKINKACGLMETEFKIVNPSQNTPFACNSNTVE